MAILSYFAAGEADFNGFCEVEELGIFCFIVGRILRRRVRIIFYVYTCGLPDARKGLLPGVQRLGEEKENSEYETYFFLSVGFPADAYEFGICY